MKYALAVVLFIVVMAECSLTPAYSQSLNGNVLRLAPSSLSLTCNNGDIRVDANDSYKLKKCGLLSNWQEITPTGAIINPMTTAGDLIVGGAVGAPGRLGIGTTNTVLTSSGSAAGWAKLLDANLDTAAAINTTKLADGSVTNTEFQYINSLTENVQTSLSQKELDIAELYVRAPILGGTTNQVLAKNSNTDYDYKWFTLPVNAITSLTGDISASGPGAASATLATVNSNVGTFGTTSQTPTLTVNAKGLVTAASQSAIAIGQTQVTNLVSDLAGKQATGNYMTALTGDITAAGPGSSAATIANGAVTNAKLAVGIGMTKVQGTVNSLVSTDASGYLQNTAWLPMPAYALTPSTPSTGLNLFTSTANNDLYARNSGGYVERFRPDADLQNLLENPGFDKGTTGWTASGGTLAAVNIGTSYQGYGPASGTFDSSSASQTLTGPTYTVSNGYAGMDGIARCRIITPSGTNTSTFGVWNGTTLLNSVSVTSSTLPQEVEATFTFGAAGTTIAPRFTSVSANEPLFSIDDCYVGLNDRTAKAFTIAEQRSVVTSNSIGIGAAVTGAASTSAGSDFYTYNSGTGVYTVTKTGTFSISGMLQVASTQVQPCINLNGTNISCGFANVVTAKSTAAYTQVLSPGNTFYVYNAVGAGTSDYGVVSVYAWSKTPASSYTVDPSFDTTGMLIPYGTATCPSGTLAADGSAVSRTTYANLFGKIGTTYGTGDGSTTFNLPNTGGIFVRGAGSQTIGGINYSTNLGEKNVDTFQGHWHNVYSPTGAGGSFVWGMQAWTNNRSPTLSYTPDQGVREPVDGGYGTPRYSTETRPAYVGAKYCIVTNGQRPMPILTGSVTSASAGPERIERVTFGGATKNTSCTTAPCPYLEVSTPGTSVSWTGLGGYNITFPTGTFSGSPTCSIWGVESGITQRICSAYGSSSTLVAAGCVDSTNTGKNVFGSVICMGPR